MCIDSTTSASRFSYLQVASGPQGCARSSQRRCGHACMPACKCLPHGRCVPVGPEGKGSGVSACLQTASCLQWQAGVRPGRRHTAGCRRKQRLPDEEIHRWQALRCGAEASGHRLCVVVVVVHGHVVIAPAGHTRPSMHGVLVRAGAMHACMACARRASLHSLRDTQGGSGQRQGDERPVLASLHARGHHQRARSTEHGSLA